MADRIAVMQAGKVVQVNTPQRLIAEPANAFVREFLNEGRPTEQSIG
jgi:ABC-type proline/glycine betaine transport system ATPase subunit